MIRRIVAGLSALLLMAGAANAQIAPDVLVKNTVSEVLSIIKTTRDKRVLSEVVEKKVLPNFDFQAMTRYAMGKYWREATPTQQRALENAFRELLVTTYTTALTQSTSEQSVEVRPVTVRPADDDVTVRTLVKDASSKPIAIDYRLAKVGSVWKVYDVTVENLSLVTNYRGSFNSEIGRSGIDGLIKLLQEKNKQNAAG